MAVLSPSLVRLERPLNDCIRILNKLGCESVHVDVYYGLALPSFLNIDSVQTGTLHALEASVTVHIFQFAGEKQIDLRFLQRTDLAVLHMFPQTGNNTIANFLEQVNIAGCRAGLSLDLKIDPIAVEGYLNQLDTIFVMGIPVATHGLQPDGSTESRLDTVASMLTGCNPNCRLGLDGGVNSSTFPKLVQKVDELVIGSILFQAADLAVQWSALQAIAKGVSR